MATGRGADAVRPATVPQWRSLSEVLTLGNRPPTYPPEALEREWEGTVRVRVEFDEQGQAAQAEVDASSGFPLLDEAALGTARGWRIDSDGRRRVLLIPVSFQLSADG